MQKLMLMRLCNTSEYKHSVNSAQELLCLTRTGINRSDFERSWFWRPTVPLDVSSVLTNRASNGQPGWDVSWPEHSLPVLGCGRNRKEWGGLCAEGRVEEGTTAGACHRNVRRVFSQHDDRWTNRFPVIRNRWKI